MTARPPETDEELTTLIRELVSWETENPSGNERRAAECVREREDDLVGNAYITVTKFETGTKENVVPEDIAITIDRRFLPSESAKRIDELLEEVEADHGIETSWMRTRTYESAAVDVDSGLADVFRDASAEHAGVPTEPWGIQASTDVRNFVNDAGMKAITWGPGDLRQSHTYDEHVRLSDAAPASGP